MRREIKHSHIEFKDLLSTLAFLLGFLVCFSESQCPKELPFSCLDRSLCVSLDRVCNGAADCSDASDERGLCSTTCEGSGCEQACRRTPLGPRCYCNAGFRLAADRTTCEDIDECLRWPPVCSQLCNNTAPGYQCACAEGYELRENGRSCSAKSRAIAYVVYIHQSSLMRLELGLPGYNYPKLLVRSKGHILAMALDMAEERVYYYDDAEMAIRKVDIHGENIQDVITNGLMSVSALALDWLGRNLYVADDQRRAVYACSLKTAMCVDLHLPQVYVPRSLVVDSTRRKLYWGDCGRMHKIASASLDGRDSTPVVEKNVLCATSLFVDLPTDTLYWADISLQRIEAQQLSGAGYRHTMSEVEQPMSVAVFEEALYWTSLSTRRRSHDQRRGIILTASKYTASKPMSLGLELPELPYSMQLYHPTLQLKPEQSECDHEYCSDICLLTETGYVCACPAGTRLTADGHTCIERWDEASLVIAHNNYLLRVLPDGVGAKTFDHLTSLPAGYNITALAYDSVDRRVYVANGFISDDRRDFRSSISYFYLNDAQTWHTFDADDIGHVTSLSVDWISRNIYWVDQTKKVIMVARLDGSSKVVLLQNKENLKVLENPFAVAVDPVGKRLYYSDCGQRSHIGVCGLTGNACTQPMFGDSRDCVTDLKIDQPHNRLYWANKLRGSVAASNLEVSEIQITIPSPRPVGVALTSKNIYYTDCERQFGGLMYRSQDNHEMKYSILTGINPLTSIVSTDPDLQPQHENVCRVSNGGCSDVCIANTDVQATCLCPDDEKLSSDERTCLPIAKHSSDSDSTTAQQSTILIEHLPKRAASIERGAAASHSASASAMFHGVPLASLRLSCLYNNRCLNGGTCIVRRADYAVCHCTENYTGSLCESLVTISTSTTLAVSTALYTSQALSTSAIIALSVCLTALFCGAVGGSIVFYRYFSSAIQGSCLSCSTALKATHVETVDAEGRMQTVLYVPSTPSPHAYDNPGYVDPEVLDYRGQNDTNQDLLENTVLSPRETEMLTVSSSVESLYLKNTSRTHLQSPIAKR